MHFEIGPRTSRAKAVVARQSAYPETLPEHFRHIGLQGAELLRHAEESVTRFVRDVAVRWQSLQARRVEAREAGKDQIAAMNATSARESAFGIPCERLVPCSPDPDIQLSCPFLST